MCPEYPWNSSSPTNCWSSLTCHSYHPLVISCPVCCFMCADAMHILSIYNILTLGDRGGCKICYNCDSDMFITKISLFFSEIFSCEINHPTRSWDFPQQKMAKVRQLDSFQCTISCGSKVNVYLLGSHSDC